MKKIHFLFLFAFALLNYACAQTKSEKLDALIRSYVKEGQFNGSVLVVAKGEIMYIQ